MDLETVTQLAEAYMGEYGLLARGWTFEFHRSVMRLGTCHYGSRRITLSKVFAQHNEFPLVVDTILHEIAHALTCGDGHGRVWAAMAEKLGAAPRTKKPMWALNIPWKYVAKCGVCQRECGSMRQRTRPAYCNCVRGCRPDNRLEFQRVA